MTSQAIAVCLSQEAVSGVHHGQVAFFRLFFFSFFFFFFLLFFTPRWVPPSINNWIQNDEVGFFFFF